ncbi:MAG: hypothetical protein RLZZ400_663 [Actinomycetota bacterium]|jgi:DNA processing protein
MTLDLELALATWSAISEPGDEFGGMLREAFGPVDALKLVRTEDAEVLAKAILSNSSCEPAAERFGNLQKSSADSIQRWLPRLQKTMESPALRHSLSKVRLVHQQNIEWPTQLTDLGWGAPAALWVDGNADLLQKSKKSVALVGARSSTKYGEWVTAEIVSQVALRGYSIVSGGAYGIDGAAHRASLAISADTVAVLAGGIDRLYPAGNQAMLLEISKTGLLVSELPPGSSPTKWRFLQRNRLIAALTKATIVVEAGYRSGSINTANHASLLGREVGAVPGPITSPSSAGCHRLIREGAATLISSADDVLELLGENSATVSASNSVGALETRALDALGRNPKQLFEIAESAGLTISEASMALTSLELAGLAVGAYGKWSRTGSNL